MSSSKFDVEKFNGENDFMLWRIKMKALMIHQGIYVALDQKAHAARKDTKVLAETNSKAHSALILSSSDEVPREVFEESSALAIWETLNSIYMKKSLANRLYLKKKLYTLQMEEGKEIIKHLDEYNRIILDLHSVGVKIEEEDQAITLLSSLPKAYELIADTMIHGKETLAMTEVKSVQNSKELHQKNEATSSGNGKELNVRGRPEKKENNNKKWRPKSRSKSRQSNKGTRKCYKCKQEWRC